MAPVIWHTFVTHLSNSIGRADTASTDGITVIAKTWTLTGFMGDRKKIKQRKSYPFMWHLRADPNGVRIIPLLYSGLSVICGHDGAESVGETLKNQNQQQQTHFNCDWNSCNEKRMGKIKAPTAEAQGLLRWCTLYDITAGVLLYNFWAHAVSSKRPPEGLWAIYAGNLQPI